MIGFALIIIIVAVLIVVFISLSMNENEDESLNSFELESFVQATLEYTTNCTARGDYIPLRKVIFRCIENQTCSSGEDPCIILENDIQAIVENSWQACPECRIRGYEFNITQAKEGSPIPDDIYHLAAGNVTIFSKTAVQNFDSGVDVHFKAYYASQ
ncbi:MAG: hypothetical protein PF542_01410 [Nanoarchaeota archaeon]|nr:hypothetical protein [Nanoarchaeota archaeon]